MNLHEFLTHLTAQPEWRASGNVTPASRASNGDTPLHAAIWAADEEAARALIDASADVNAAGEDAYTPLHAAIAQRNAPLARRLTNRGGSWDAINVIGAGSAVLGTLADLAACDAQVVAVAALAVVGTSAPEIAARHGVPLEALATYPTTIWTPGECPMCKSGVPLEQTA